MIQIHPVATTYARALLEIGVERRESDVYAEELAALRREVFDDGDLRVFLESPKIPRREKREVIERALEGRVSVLVLNLLRVLIDRGRQLFFDEIVESFLALQDEVAGRVHVELRSAVPLPAEPRDHLVELLARKLDKQIVPEEAVDETLLGGLTIRVGDAVIDGSVRARLNEIRERVASRRLGSDLIDEDQR